MSVPNSEARCINNKITENIMGINTFSGKEKTVKLFSSRLKRIYFKRNTIVVKGRSISSTRVDPFSIGTGCA